MEKLIDADAAIDALKELTANGTNKGMVFGEDAVHRIEMLPSVQPDIIRCKDCEYLCNEDGLRGMCWHINGFGTDIKDKYNNFCSWAKRREDG